MRFVLFIFLWLGAVGASAQSAANYFHNAAGLYINGEMETAEQEAEAGLAIDPDDVKLQALLERIREEQEEQMRQNHQRDEGDEGEQSDDQQDLQNEQQSEGESDRQESDQQYDGPGNQNLPQDDQSAESDRPDEAQQEPEQQEPEQQADQQSQDGHEDEQQEPSQPQSGEDEAEPEDAQPVQTGRMSRAEAERILGALRADESALLRSIQRRPANPRGVERDW